MKYSLRTLFIVVTAVAVLLGGRIEYLRRYGAFHQHEALRHYWRIKKDVVVGPRIEDFRFPKGYESRLYLHHQGLADEYRKALYLPWTIVNETPLPSATEDE
jgi:hypothetical protein